MSKRKRKKRKGPHRPRAIAGRPPAAAATGEPDGVVLRVARVACLVGLPALLLLSPTLSYMRGARLFSENNLFQWNCVQALATVVATLWLAAVALGEVPRLRLHRVDVAFIGFFLVMLLSSLLVPYHFDSFRRLKEMLAGVVFYIVAKNLFADERQQRLLIRVLMGMLGLFAVFGVVHYLWYVLDIKPPFLGPNLHPDAVAWEKDFGVRATSVAGNPNFLASSLLVLLPLGLAWLVMHKRPRVTLGPVVATIMWILIAAVLLGVTVGASERFVKVESESQARLESGVITQAQKQDLDRRLESSRKTAASWADWTKAWTVVGMVGLVAMLWLWPFFGTAVAVVLGFALLLFTNSWAAYSGFIVGLVVFALFIFIKRPARFRPAPAAALGGAFAVALVAFLAIKYFSGSSVIPPPEARTGGRAREILYDTAPRMIKARPLFGFGADNFFVYSNKYMSQILPGPSKYEEVMTLNPAAFVRDPNRPPPSRITLFPQKDAAPGTVSLLTKGKRLVMEKHAAIFINNPRFIGRNPGRVHSEYLAVLIEAGVVGLGVFVAIFIFFYTGTLGAWRRGDDSWRSVVFVGSSAAIAGVAAMQTVDFPFRLPWATCLIGSALALATAWHRGRSIELRLKLPIALRAGLVLLVVAIGVYLLATGRRQMRTLQASNKVKADYETLGLPTQAILDEYERLAARGSRDHNVYFGLPEMLVYLGKLDDSTARAIEELAEIQPYHEKVHYLWGQYYRKAGDAGKAVEHYRRALDLEPRYMKARVFLIDTLVKANRLDEAKEAIAEAWAWEAESEARMQLALQGSARVKMEQDMPMVHIDDLYWPWVINADATVRALEGDFEGARNRWKDAERRWLAERSGLAFVDQGLYGLFPEAPIFLLNVERLNGTSLDEVRADRATLAMRFYGVADYETYKRLDDEYRAVLRWGAPVPGVRPAIITRQEAARRAQLVLDEIVKEFGERVLVIDGNLAREYHNRRGLLMLQMGEAGAAGREFELSAAGRGGDVARANLAALRNVAPDGRLVLPLIDEQRFEQIHRRLGELHYRRYVGKNITPEQYLGGLKALSTGYPHYMPVAITAIGAHAETGYRDEARRHLDLLEKWYPDDPRPQRLRARLGL